MREKDILSDKEFLGLASLRKIYKAAFVRYRIPGDFEDFFQQFQMDYVSGYRQHQRADHFAIDYLRTILGPDGRKASLQRAQQFIDGAHGDNSDEIYHSLFELHDSIKQLSGRARVIVGLVLIYGLTETEISFLFDVTPSRISQFIADVVHGRKDIPWTDEKRELGTTSSLSRIEHAAKYLGVSANWLKEKLEEIQ